MVIKIGATFVFLLAAVALTGYFLLSRQSFQSRASVAADGVAEMRLSPESSSVEVGSDQVVNIYFKTATESAKSLAVKLTYPYSTSEPTASASALTLDPDLPEGWTCPTKSISEETDVATINLGCVFSGTSGFHSASDVLLASFKLTFDNELDDPLVVEFDAAGSFVLNMENHDVLKTPSSKGHYSTGEGEGLTHLICINGACAKAAGSGNNTCATEGAECTQTFSPAAATNCTGKYDPNCYDCVPDGEINIFDYQCFQSAYKLKKGTGVTWAE